MTTRVFSIGRGPPGWVLRTACAVRWLASGRAGVGLLYCLPWAGADPTSGRKFASTRGTVKLPALLSEARVVGAAFPAVCRSRGMTVMLAQE